MTTLLLIDDDRVAIHLVQRYFEQSEIKVISCIPAPEAVKAAAKLQPDVVILDFLLPDQSGVFLYETIRRYAPAVPVIFVMASGNSEAAIESMRLGVMDYLSKPLDAGELREVVARAISIGALTRATLARDDSDGSNRDKLAGATSTAALIGHCPAIQAVYKAIGRVAGQNISVLIRGESGTGKELVARAIHQHSPRAGKKFLTINCAAIPEALLESELFGHEKGAFTGATSQRIGKIEECDGGTLFLDEVGDMSLAMQSKVLRATQEMEFERVGGNRTIRPNTRIVAATNRDLDAMVVSGEFRADLCYRLNGYSIVLPPLRARRGDIPILVNYYLRRFNSELGKAISCVATEAMELLTRHDWPGNIRELQTVIKHAMLHAIGPVLVPEYLPSQLRGPSLCGPSEPHKGLSDFRRPAIADWTNRPRTTLGAVSDVTPTNGEIDFREFVEKGLRRGTDSLYADSIQRMECTLLTEVLRFTDGNHSRAALLLGITRGCLRGKVRAHGIMFNTSVGIQDSTAGLRAMEDMEVNAAASVIPDKRPRNVPVCLKVDALRAARGRCASTNPLIDEPLVQLVGWLDT